MREPFCTYRVLAAAKPQIHVRLQRCLRCVVLYGDRAMEVALLPNADARVLCALVLVVNPHSEMPLNRSVEIRRELASFLDFVAGNAGMVPNVAEPSGGVVLERNSRCTGRGIISRVAL